MALLTPKSSIIHKIISSTISKSSKKKCKRNSPRFQIQPGQTSPWLDNFCADQKVSEEWKENFLMLLENSEKSCTKLKLYSQKNKFFRIQFPWRNNQPQHYITLQMKVRREKQKILLVSRNQQFQKLSCMFCFYFRNFLACIYLTKQNNYFTNRKSYRTSLFIEN